MTEWFRRLVVLVFAVTLAIAVAQSADDLLNPPPGEWPQFGRTPDMQRFSPLDQINASNVGQLRLAWSIDLGSRFDGAVQGGPVVWNGSLYQLSDTGVIALDATNGNVLWEFSRNIPDEMEGQLFVPRAPRAGPVVYDGKVFITHRSPVLLALDAATGEVLWETTVGQAALAEGFTTGPIFADGKIIAGPTGADFGGAPGRILALNAEDGELLWTFNTVPLSPDDPAYASWNPVPPSWEDGVGGASAWNAGTYDPVTRTVIYGTGQPTPWDRLDHRRRDDDGTVSDDLYTASFVAVDVDTGELRWYHQVVPGDEWDYDQHTIPVVADVEFNGEPRRVAILATTTGFIVNIDIATGEFLGAHQIHPENTVHIGYSDDGTAIINPAARYTEEDVAFRVCPGIRWAHIAPGAFSPNTGLLYRPNNNICTQLGAQTMPDDWEPGERAYWALFAGQAEGDYFDRWGGLTAIEPSSGEVVWEFGYGYPHNAGALVTGGDLVFSAFADRTFRAFDAATGEVLWEQILTAHSDGSPVTYEVGGAQYVAVIVGSTGGTAGIPALGLPRTIPGNPAIFAFRLP
jgi:PQQ-dependent dehydrogenase (methanol/ethanol family)